MFAVGVYSTDFLFFSEVVMTQKYITQKDFEEITGKSRGWQWLARKQGVLGYYKINSRILYSEKHLQDFMSRFEVATEKEQGNTEGEING